MCSGKTSIGKRLAKHLGYHFYDIDAEIEKALGKSITNIFEENGESFFRRQERIALLNLTKEDNVVVATGGGTPCFYDNMEVMKKSGTTIYLKLTAETLIKRLEYSRKTRPLVALKIKDELSIYVHNTLKERESYYNKAEYIIDGDYAGIENITSLVSEK